MLNSLGVKGEDFVKYINERNYAETQIQESRKSNAAKNRATVRLE